MSGPFIKRILIRILFCSAILINVLSLKDGHNWGDDFSQYIINARNIVESKPFSSGIMLDNPTIYPPGFALLLVPVFKAFGLNFIAFKFLNILFWYGGIAFLYFLFVKIGGKRFAVGSALFLAFSSFFFVYKQNVLSDIPFFFFVCWALYAFEEYRAKQGVKYLLSFIAAISIALWIRSAGSVLFFTAFFYFIFIERKPKEFLTIFLAFLLNSFLLYLWVGVHPGFILEIIQRPLEFLELIIQNFNTVFRGLGWFVCPAQIKISAVLFKAIDYFLVFCSPILYLIIAATCAHKFKKKSLSYLECFSFFYLTLFVFWAGFTMPPDAFTRFVLPLLPGMFIYFYYLLNALRTKWPAFDGRQLFRLIFLLLFTLNVLNIVINWNFNDDAINRQENKELVQWVKKNISPEEHFMFWKPRGLALLTHREGTAPWIFRDGKEDFEQRVKEFKIAYIILFKYSNNELMAQLESSKEFNSVWENNLYKIFKIRSI